MHLFKLELRTQYILDDIKKSRQKRLIKNGSWFGDKKNHSEHKQQYQTMIAGYSASKYSMFQP